MADPGWLWKLLLHGQVPGLTRNPFSGCRDGSGTASPWCSEPAGVHLPHGGDRRTLAPGTPHALTRLRPISPRLGSPGFRTFREAGNGWKNSQLEAESSAPSPPVRPAGGSRPASPEGSGRLLPSKGACSGVQAKELLRTRGQPGPRPPRASTWNPAQGPGEMLGVVVPPRAPGAAATRDPDYIAQGAPRPI